MTIKAQINTGDEAQRRRWLALQLELEAKHAADDPDFQIAVQHAVKWLRDRAERDRTRA